MVSLTCFTAAAYTGGKLKSFSTPAEIRLGFRSSCAVAVAVQLRLLYFGFVAADLSYSGRRQVAQCVAWKLSHKVGSIALTAEC